MELLELMQASMSTTLSPAMDADPSVILEGLCMGWGGESVTTAQMFIVTVLFTS